MKPSPMKKPLVRIKLLINLDRTLRDWPSVSDYHDSNKIMWFRSHVCFFRRLCVCVHVGLSVCVCAYLYLNGMRSPGSGLRVLILSNVCAQASVGVSELEIIRPRMFDSHLWLFVLPKPGNIWLERNGKIWLTCSERPKTRISVFD